MKIITLFLLFCSFVNFVFADVYVRGYTKSNGTYVQGHYRSSPNHTKADNWSTYGNINPYTGKVGTKKYNDYNNYGRANKGSTDNQPNVTNGHYYGSILLCDDGYKDIGGQCRKLPNVTNGRYYGSILLCDDGYRDIGGQCR